MKKKYYDIPIEHPLTDERRELIGKYILENAHLSKGTVTYNWAEDNSQLLNLHTPPVDWEIYFHPGNVEVLADGPGWAKLLFTKKRQEELRKQLEDLFRQAGFNGKKVAKKGK